MSFQPKWYTALDRCKTGTEVQVTRDCLISHCKYAVVLETEHLSGLRRMTEVSKEEERGLYNLSTAVLSTPSPKTARQGRVPKAKQPTLQQAGATMVITACHGGTLTCCSPASRCRCPCQLTSLHGRNRRQVTADFHKTFEQTHVQQENLPTTGTDNCFYHACSTPSAPEAYSCLRQAQHRSWTSHSTSSCAAAAGKRSARKANACQRP